MTNDYSEVIYNHRNTVDEVPEINLDKDLLDKIEFPKQDTDSKSNKLVEIKIQDVYSEESLTEEDEKLKRSLLINSVVD